MTHCARCAVFELAGRGGGLNPQLFSHCQIIYWESSMYHIGLHTIYITILVGLRSSKSSASQLIFHSSNTALKERKD